MKNKLKIGILSFYYPHLGGSGIVTTRIGRNLARMGQEVHFIGYDSDENPAYMEELGIKLHKIDRISYPCLKNEPYSWTLASKICEVHKEHNLDLIHANYAIPHALSAFAAREKLKQDGEYLPYVVTGHGSDIHTNGYKTDINPILQLCLNQADALTFVSNDLKEIAEKSLGINKKGIHIPNFVDTSDFYREPTKLRKKLNVPENAFVIGHVSNFAPIKQVHYFSDLAKYLKNEETLSNVYFFMCGDGKERASLEEEINKSQISEHFRFLGKLERDDLVEVYNSMDAFVLASKHEGNPLTLLEAMACEVVVIGTNVGGISETIEDSGFLFNQGDIKSLSKIVLNLKDNKTLCDKMRKKGLKRVQNKYSVQGVMNQYYDVYDSVMNNNGAC